MRRPGARKILSNLTLAVCLTAFLYPIFKMTGNAMDNDVNLHPVYMVIIAILLSAGIHQFRKK